jgi:hypothetical protein
MAPRCNRGGFVGIEIGELRTGCIEKRQLPCTLAAVASLNPFPSIVMDARALGPALILPLVVWRVYRRVRRNIGPQPLRPRRLGTAVVLFSLATVLLGVALWRHVQVVEGLAGGLLAGVVLAWFGLKLTRFSTTENGHFYTPNTYIGISLSLLLVARLAYRFMQVAAMSRSGGQPAAGMTWSPLTMAVFGLMAGYYVAYYAGLLVRGRAHIAKAAP